MVSAFNTSKVVLNIHTWFGKYNYGPNPRVFEANGCGAFQMSDYKDEILELYEPEKKIVRYNDIPELKKKLFYYLQHTEKRTDIAKTGMQRTVHNHTYEQGLQEMFNVAGFE